METKLNARFSGFEFKHVTSISERPDGAMVASLGIPSFIPGTENVTILSFGSRFIQDATPQQRSDQWTTLRDKEATVEDVLAELGSYTEYQVLNGAQLKDTKMAIADIRCTIAEAESLEDKLAAYRVGFETLLKTIA